MSSRDFPRDLYGAQEGAFVAFWAARGVVPHGFTLIVSADEARAQECFFAGFRSRLVRRLRRPSISRGRVSRGSMTSST